MKKLNSLFLCLFSLLTLISCGNNMQLELEELIENTNNSIISAKYEINLSINEARIDAEDSTQRTQNSYSKTSIMEIDYNKRQATIVQDYNKYYYINDYLTNGYTSQLLTWDELMGNAQTSPQVNKNIFDFKPAISKKNQNGVAIFEVLLKDSDIKSILSIEDYNFNEDIILSKYKVVFESNDHTIINKTTISFSYINYSYYFNYEGDVTITSTLMSKDVNVQIPLEIVEGVREVIDQNYTGPRGYRNIYNNPYTYQGYPYNIYADPNIINNDIMSYHKIDSRGLTFDHVSGLAYSISDEKATFYSYSDLTIVYEKKFDEECYVAAGKLLIINDNPARIEVYDLKTFALVKQTNLPDTYYFPLIFTSNKLILIVNSRQYEYNIDNGIFSMSSQVLPRADEYLYDSITNRIYAYERFHNELYSINPNTYSFTKSSVAYTYQLYPAVKQFYLTSEGIHINQRIYDFETLQDITDTIFTDEYYSLLNFIPRDIVYIDDQYTVLAGYSISRSSKSGENFYYCMAIYNRAIKKYVFTTYKACYSVTRNKDDFIVFPSEGSSAFIRIKADKLVTPLEDQFISDYKIENNGDEKYLHRRKVISDVSCNEKYIFIFDNEKNIKVHDIQNLSLVKEIELPFIPVCLDVYENTLVVGGGQENQMVIINIATWHTSRIDCDIAVEAIKIYQNKIILTDQDYWSKVFIFDINKNNFQQVWYSYSNADIAVDKKEGILYIGEKGSSGSDLYYYDLDRDFFIYTSSKSFSYGYGLSCDGYNVFYYGLIFDKRTGERYLKEDYIPMFPDNNSYKYLGCIFYSGTYSVVIASKNELIYTLVYNKSTNTIREIPLIASGVLETDTSLILHSKYYNTLVTVKK